MYNKQTKIVRYEIC